MLTFVHMTCGLLDHMGHGHAYETYGIDKSVGAIVVVRPDQCELGKRLIRGMIEHVSNVTRIHFLPDISLIVGLEDTDLLEAYFAGFMKPAQDGGFPAELIPKMQPPSWEYAPAEPDSKANLLGAQTIPVEQLAVA